MSKYVLISKFAADSGYTVKAVERMIERGVWVEGVHYRRAPNGRIHVNTEVYELWVEGRDTQALKSIAAS